MLWFVISWYHSYLSGKLNCHWTNCKTIAVFVMHIEEWVTCANDITEKKTMYKHTTPMFYAIYCSMHHSKRQRWNVCASAFDFCTFANVSAKSNNFHCFWGYVVHDLHAKNECVYVLSKQFSTSTIFTSLMCWTGLKKQIQLSTIREFLCII